MSFFGNGPWVGFIVGIVGCLLEAAVWPGAAWAGGVDVGKMVAFCCKSDSTSMI